MKRNLKEPLKLATQIRPPLKPRRSSSFSFGQRRPSVHWISPSVFEKPQKNSQENSHAVTLSEVFNAPNVPVASQTTTATNVKRNNKKTRKHNELPKLPNEPQHQSKKVKKEQPLENNKSPEFITLQELKKPIDRDKRLSYILNNDPYNVLGVSPSATKSVMKNVYKKKAIEMHPDKGGSEDDFIKLKSAYEILVDDKYGFGIIKMVGREKCTISMEYKG